MSALIIGLILFVSVLLILVILAQNSKGGGLSSQFGGSGASNMIGVKKTSDLLEKITWGLAISLLVLSMAATNIGKKTFERTNKFSDKIQSPAETTVPSSSMGGEENVDSEIPVEPQETPSDSQ
ncbi:MAG: preprotein translocase subunit SecG [Cyclobacteriaceae bacterium]|nr:preprotein translocase subunit SecG [Cyclobacteriaceae bacterium]